MMNVFTPPRIGSIERTDHDRVIVGCGIGAYYRERLRSTVNHCNVYCPDAWTLFYDELPPCCPEHKNDPYAFKIFALQQAFDAGFRYALWMDTSFQPVASIEPLWKHIEARGFYAGQQGDSKLGEWTNDAALKIFKLDRDVAMRLPLLYSGLVGLDFSGSGRWAYLKWRDMYAHGTFHGYHFQDELSSYEGHKWRGSCSTDPRCKGHRHDESALSYVAYYHQLFTGRTGFTTFEDPQGFIGHMVPDYDVVKMRQKLWELSGNTYYDAEEREEMADLCR